MNPANRHERAERVLQIGKPKIQANAIPLVQSSWRDFLQDMRRRLPLRVPLDANQQDDLRNFHGFLP